MGVSRPDELSRLQVSGQVVGVVGLAEVFAEVAGLELTDGQRREELLRRFVERNYLPEPARGEYAAALWQAYRVWRGDAVEPAGEASGRLRVAVLGPGCAACQALLDEVRRVLSDAGLSAEVEHVRGQAELLQYGLVAYPALVVNGVVRAAGRRPTRRQLREILEERP